MIPLFVAAALAPIRTHHAPRVDGHLDDPAWQAAPVSDAFTQKFPRDGAAPTDPTRARVVYDDDSVYIAIECVQRGEHLARLTRRDREVGDDRVSVDIDTAHDRRNAFHFQISAAGVLLDGLRYDDTELSTDWDDVWQGEVARTPTGWTAELRIPLRILRLHRGVDTWGFQVRRWNGKTGELDEWAYASKDVGGEVSRYGEVGPFEGLRPRQSLALVPFALTRAVRTDAAIPSPYGDGLSAAAGLDVAWRPAANAIVVGAVLPDFAQVEADQVVVNLTTSETQFPEKRPFFLQGLDLFQTPIQLLYTRRIGATPESPALLDGVTQLRPVGAAPILGAAKLVANAGGVELAALSAITGPVDAPTDAGDVAAAGTTSHHVARVRITRDGVALGGLATAQLSGEPDHPAVMDGRLCPSGDVVVPGARCAHDAYTAGLDGGWRSSDGTWKAAAQLAATRIEGGPPRTRPDGTVMRSGDTGFGGILDLAKEGGALRGEFVYEAFGRRFDIDDLGFQDRANFQHASLDLEAYRATPLGPFVESKSRVELFWRRTWDGLRGPSGYQWNVSGTTEDTWHGFLELHWRPAIYDDRELGDGRALQRAGKLGLEVDLRTDTRHAVVGGATVYAAAKHGASEVQASAEVDLRPRDNLELALVPQLLIDRGEPRFVDGGDAGGPRFARLDARSFGITARATWTLQRDLTVQAYVQALLATIRFRDPLVSDPARRAIALADLQPGGFDASMYDSREGALNANLVARWEYRPGSTAYLVYSHAQSPAGGGATYEPSALVRGPAQDVVLLKLSWAWLR